MMRSAATGPRHSIRTPNVKGSEVPDEYRQHDREQAPDRYAAPDQKIVAADFPGAEIARCRLDRASRISPSCAH